VDALQFFTDYLCTCYATDHKLSFIIDDLNLAIQTDTEGQFFQGLMAAFIYKEEVKAPKTSKKKQVDTAPPPENPVIIQMRRLALKAIYYMILVQIDENTEATPLQRVMTSLPLLPQHLCDSLLRIFQDIESTKSNPIDQAHHIQDALYLLRSLAFAMRYNAEIGVALANRLDVTTHFISVLQIPQLKFYLLECILLLTRCDLGLEVITTEQMMEDLLVHFHDANKTLSDMFAQLHDANPNTKGAKPPPKKDDKLKKGAQVVEVEDPLSKLDKVHVEAKRENIIIIHLIVQLLTQIAMRHKDIINASHVQRILSIMQSFSALEWCWTEFRVKTHPFDIPLHRTLEYLAMLLGSLGEISENIRLLVCSLGAIPTLQTLMLKSRKACSAVAPTAEHVHTDSAHHGHNSNHADTGNASPLLTMSDDEVKEELARTLSLRRYIEKAIFALLADDVSISPTCTSRWTSCLSYSISSPDRVVGYGATFLTLLGDLLDGLEVPSGVEAHNEKDSKANKKAAANAPAADTTNTKPMTIFDADMGSRAARLLAAVLTSSANVEELMAKTQMDKILTLKLSNFLQRLINYSLENKESCAIHILDPKIELALFNSLIVLEYFLASNADNLKVFVTKERLEVLMRVMEVYGPCVSENNDNINSVETNVSMIDPRHFDWSLSTKGSMVEELHLLRPLLMDLCSILAAADGKYRSYEGNPSFPLAICAALPRATSAVEDCSLLSIHTLSDTILRTLLLPVHFAVNQDRIVIKLADNEKVLHEEVRNAGLKYLFAVSSSQTVGVLALLEGTAKRAFSSSWVNTSCSKFIAALRREKEFDPSNMTFQRPQLFSDITPIDGTFGTIEHLAEHVSLWPFLALNASIVSVLADPRSTATSSILALQALQGLSSTSHFLPTCQPVVYDVLNATCLLIGGGNALVSILGRFGQIDHNSKAQNLDLFRFLASRGTSRETFWREYMLANKEEVQIDPKTGKPIVKKDDKKGKDAKDNKKVDPKSLPPPSIVSEVVYNIESTETRPDPNAGPNSNTWKSLLDLQFHDYRLHIACTNLLISSVIGQLSPFVELLIAQKVHLNAQDDEGRTALMYALLLNDSSAIDYLLQCDDIDSNSVDYQGTPTINFAYYSLSEDDINTHLPGALPDVSQSLVVDKAVLSCAAIKIFTSPLASEQALACTKFDINVADAKGYGPMFLAMGQSEVIVYLAGYRFSLRPIAYHDETYPKDSIHTNVRRLLDRGLLINSCCKEGSTALHLAAAWGDFELVKYLIEKGSSINALDNQQRHALHYLLACCPAQSIEIFDFISSQSLYRPLQQMNYNDYRTGRPAEEKSQTELALFLDSILADIQQPSILSQQRLLWTDILTLQCMDSKSSVLFILLTGPELFLKHPFFKEAIVGDKINRFHVALHILACAKAQECIKTVCDFITCDEMTILHALAMLCKGITEQVPLTDKQKRNKRVKSYPSPELELFDIVLNNTSNLQVNKQCKFTIYGQSSWTPLHMAIVQNNTELIRFLLQHDNVNSFTSIRPLHFMANVESSTSVVSTEVANMLINTCKDSDQSKQLLNDTITMDNNTTSTESYAVAGAPIHFAVLRQQTEVLKALCSCNKVDVNQRHPILKHTALTLACYMQNMELVEALSDAQDRLDFAVTSASLGAQPSIDSKLVSASLLASPCCQLSEVSCVDVTLQSHNLALLQLLTKMRRNDVIEQLITDKPFFDRSEAKSWLWVLEEENHNITTQYQQAIQLRKASAHLGVEGDTGIAQEIAKEEEQDEPTDPIPVGDEETALEESMDEQVETVQYTIESVEHDHIEEDEEANADPEPLPTTSSDNDNTAIDDGHDNNVSSVNYEPLSDEDLESLSKQLQRSNEIVSFIIDLVNASGVVSKDFHYNERYFANELYCEI
jgi:ankyrin repeat protein